jgi:hypothetical protein
MTFDTALPFARRSYALAPADQLLAEANDLPMTA